MTNAKRESGMTSYMRLKRNTPKTFDALSKQAKIANRIPGKLGKIGMLVTSFNAPRVSHFHENVRKKYQ